MELRYEILNGTPSLVLADRLNEEDAARLSPEIRRWSDRLLGLGVQELPLDFGGVTLVCGAVLRGVLTTATRVRSHGGTLLLGNLSPDIAEALRTSGFLELFAREGKVTAFASAPAPKRPRGADSRLDLLLGSERLPCADGEVIGTEGSLRPELFVGIPGVAAKHVTFHQTPAGWSLTVAEEANLKTKLDAFSLAPGQTGALEGAGSLQLGALRLRFEVTPGGPMDAPEGNPDGEIEEYGNMITAMAGSVVNFVCGTSGAAEPSQGVPAPDRRSTAGGTPAPRPAPQRPAGAEDRAKT